MACSGTALPFFFTKISNFRGKELARTKDVIDGIIIEQAFDFNNLGQTANGRSLDLENKIHRFNRQFGALKRTSRKNIKQTLVIFYKILSIPSLCIAVSVGF
jgi:hypothetical protein